MFGEILPCNLPCEWLADGVLVHLQMPLGKRVLGIACMLLVVVIWVASSELMVDIFEKFPKPLFLTYLNTSCFSLYLFGFVLFPWRQQHATYTDLDRSDSGSAG